MDQIKMSLRNLLRNYKRTVLTMSVLVLGIVGMLVYAGYIDFSMWGFREQTIKGGLGHFRVYKKGYNSRGSERSINYLIENEREVYRLLMRTAHIREVTPELEVQGILSNGEVSEITLGRGYDVTSVSIIKDSFKVVEGEFITDADSYEIALGSILAEKLNATIGSYLTIMTTTRQGGLNAIDLMVVGIIETGIDEYDERLSIMSIDIAQMLLDVNAPERYVVMLDDTDAVDSVTASLKDSGMVSELGIEIRTWSELAKFYHQVKEMNETYFFITQLIILVIVAFSIVNTMRMVIYERMREIGTIRAIGMTRAGVVRMFFYEGVWLGVFSFILGIVAAVGVAWVINFFGGIYIAPPPGQSTGYHTMIRPDMIRYFQVGCIVMFSVILGSLIPAFRAARVKIDESLRYI
ncbi:MAG: FtsX-like permease family protein [Spirochaetes bacterium]|jgi:putative ABC transport system permease protein|nr:FtsX-like permease family protein [Spirochaetota bacterium]